MKKFIPRWYDDEEVKATDPVIEAENEAEATKKAYELHNGTPPAKMLYLEEVS